jgi:thiol-disulfide isomerase/thioredoxin
MAKYVNFNANSLPALNDESTGIFSRIKSAGSGLSTNTLLIACAVILLGIIAIFYYFYYIAPSSKANYHANSEQNSSGQSSQSGQTSELLFFFADWCPHCKAAKPIWNDLKTEYENKTINGYKVIFTEVDCSEESAEVEKLMNQYSVEGYPTIKLLKDGQIIEYDAKPSNEMLIKFLNTAL